MTIPGLSSALWRAVRLAQNFNWNRVAHDVRASVQCRAFSRKLEEFDSDGAKKPRPKTESVPRITLMSPDNSTTVTVLEVAQRLAKRRNLTLIKVSDPDGKTQRPLYKLVNTGLLKEIEEDTKDAGKAAKKSNKLLYVSAKITEHDLRTKMKNVVRLLNKGHKVKVAITLDGFDGVSFMILLFTSSYTATDEVTT